MGSTELAAQQRELRSSGPVDTSSSIPAGHRPPWVGALSVLLGTGAVSTHGCDAYTGGLLPYTAPQ